MLDQNKDRKRNRIKETERDQNLRVISLVYINSDSPDTAGASWNTPTYFEAFSSSRICSTCWKRQTCLEPRGIAIILLLDCMVYFPLVPRQTVLVTLYLCSVAKLLCLCLFSNIFKLGPRFPLGNEMGHLEVSIDTYEI